jgi:2-polyprenyl-3-methyl-5-hydroxy-6-metoxy-1,4-benzoquinol methylase
MSKLLFDEPYYLEINSARWAVAEQVFKFIVENDHIPAKTCLDVGCGPGWFAGRISKMGFAVTGLEGRPELAEIATQRYPAAIIKQLNIEEPGQLSKLSPADIVLCFGILYHVENPFMLLRNLHALTNQILFLETIVVPSEYPCAWLVDEGRNETQGLSHHAFILSKPALVAILQRVGFSCVLEYKGPVPHQDFSESAHQHKRRCIFVASHAEIILDQFEKITQPSLPKFDFTKTILLE